MYAYWCSPKPCLANHGTTRYRLPFRLPSKAVRSNALYGNSQRPHSSSSCGAGASSVFSNIMASVPVTNKAYKAIRLSLRIQNPRRSIFQSRNIGHAVFLFIRFLCFNNIVKKQVWNLASPVASCARSRDARPTKLHCILELPQLPVRYFELRVSA